MTTLRLTSTHLTLPAPRASLYRWAYFLGSPYGLLIYFAARRFGWIGAAVAMVGCTAVGGLIANLFRAIETERLMDDMETATEEEEYEFSGPVGEA